MADGQDGIQKYKMEPKAAQKLASDVAEVLLNHGNALIPPEAAGRLNLQGMSYARAIETIQRIAREQEAEVKVEEQIVGNPLDAAFALYKAINRTYGWTDLRATPTFWGDEPPAMIALDIGLNDTVQVPWGRILIPGVDGEITTCANHLKDGEPTLTIHGVCKKKHREKIADLIKTARAILKEESVYKGKALRVNFDQLVARGEGSAPVGRPRFLDLTRVNPEELIFPEAIERQLEINVFGPVMHTQEFRNGRIPLKKGVLLAGPYGVGKTQLMSVLGKLATNAPDGPWTYIHIESVTQLEAAIKFARHYQPAIICAEDLDQVIGTAERDEQTNRLLNIVDGVDSKGTEIMIVLTTNHVETISPAMMRAGRIDYYLNIPPPDARAATRLIQLYGRDKLAVKEDTEMLEYFAPAGEALKGMNAASIREVVERSKSAALVRRAASGGKETGLVTPQDIIDTRRGMEDHLELMKPRVPTPAPSLERQLVHIVKESVRHVINAEYQAKDQEGYERLRLPVPAFGQKPEEFMPVVGGENGGNGNGGPSRA